VIFTRWMQDKKETWVLTDCQH